MNRYYVDAISHERRKYYFICSSNDMVIIKEPTKYLKHKTNEHRSPNTVKNIAYAISYYLAYLTEQELSIESILKMKYAEQNKHFTSFLCWLQAGNHCDRNKKPNNNTCNSYLKAVFGFYNFLLLEYEIEGDIRVLEQRSIGYIGRSGVQFRKTVQSFKSYLPAIDSTGRTIERDKIVTLLDSSSNIRDQLLILLLEETGFRIGELLGVKYADDIDYENKYIYVKYREDNDNQARAKRAEDRRSKISNGTFDLLIHYMNENRKVLKNQEYLFITLYGKTKGKALTVNAVYSVFKILEKKTGIKATPHMFRHYFANERRKAKWEINLISTALGHKSIYTTEKYMNIEDGEMEVVMEEYFRNNKGLFDSGKLM